MQLYEIAAGLAALGVWWAVTSPRFRGVAGQPFLPAVVVYAGGRLFVDAFKETPPLMAGGLHMVQVVALAVVLLGLFILARPAQDREAIQAGE